MSLEQKRFFQAGREAERERIAWCLRKLAENVLKPSEYRDGYLQAADDVEANNWPSDYSPLPHRPKDSKAFTFPDQPDVDQ